MFHVSAWIGSLNLASGYLLSPLGSYITDRFSYRFTAILGSLLGIIGFLLASLSSKLWMMYPTYGLVSGFGYRIIYNSSMLVVVDYFVKWRSLAVGIVASATAVGMFVMSQVTKVLLNAFGWQGTLRGFAALYSVCGFCSTVFVPLDKLEEDRIYNNSAKKRSQKETGNLSLYRNRSFLIMLSSFVVVSFSYFIPTVHIVSTKRYILNIASWLGYLFFQGAQIQYTPKLIQDKGQFLSSEFLTSSDVLLKFALQFFNVI